MNKAKRLLVLALTVILCAGSVISPATAESPEAPATEPAIVEVQAEEPKAEAPKTEEPKSEPKVETKVETKVEKDEDTGADLTATTTTTTNDDGNDTITVTIEKEWSTDEESTDPVISGEETTTTTTTTTETTTETETEITTETTETTITETEGEESREYTEDVQPGQEVPDVTVELIPGEEPTTGSAEETVTETTTEGALPEGDEDFEYSETTTTTTTEREVTAETEDITIEVTKDDIDLDSIAPEDYEGKQYDSHKVTIDNPQADGLLNGSILDYFEYYPEDVLTSAGIVKQEQPTADGYDYLLVGSGDATWAAAPVFMNVVYVRDKNGNALKDENGNYIIDEEKSTLVDAGSKAGNSGMDGTPSQLVLKKEGENGEEDEYFYTYCIDKETQAIQGVWYNVENLEDNDYYASEESAEKIRAIVTNGYWGTEEGTGSLKNIKELMSSTYGATATVTVKDANGVEHTFNVADLIKDLSEHEALAATQAAIWSYSNGSMATQNGEDGVMLIGVQSAEKCFNSGGGALNQYKAAYNLESDARLKAVYELLMGLEGISADAKNEEGESLVTTIINEKNAVEDMNLTVKEKAENHENNYDDDDDNDVYNTAVSFKLAFVPDPENDDLLVMLTDSKGNILTDANGDPIVRRLAGENSDGREADTITADENGVYVLTGLQLGENNNYTFDLRLEGTQYLKEGVYVYSAFGERGESQTLVGLAEGERDVEVAVGMTIKFDVDEKNTVTAERKWSSKKTSTNTTSNTIRKEVPVTEEEDPTDEEETPETPTTPTRRTTNEYPIVTVDGEEYVAIGEELVPLADAVEDGLVEILDEEIPLAAVPQTGDGSGMMAMMSLMSLAGIVFLTKKKEVSAN